MGSLENGLQSAKTLRTKDPPQAVEQLKAVIFNQEFYDADSQKVKETALSELLEIYVEQKAADELSQLLTHMRPLFVQIPKAKTAKIVRMVIDSVAKLPDSTALQLKICKEQVSWATEEKRTFLRQRIELRMAALYLENKSFTEALGIIHGLLKEVKRLDDKLLLVDIHLLESRVHHQLRNIPKSKAALTAARTAANAIYIPPTLQAEIDMQSGILNAQERDYKTSYSYFFEAFEQLNSLDDPRAIKCLKYMLMCRVMTGDAADVPTIITSKAGLKFSGVEIECMRAVANAQINRSLKDFQKTTEDYKEELLNDDIVSTHIQELYDNFLEKNLQRIIEPYSRVEITYIAQQIELETSHVEYKLSQMILDKKLIGTLDQGSGCLEIFDEPKEDLIQSDALEVFDSLGRVVDTLFARSSKIVA
eukprot:TRINITY_DN2026_c0_g1_i2.p1 TRINITY_DN2026_c0_g1~~TRINITY_DN2026_c0_g1_i2.p1  ORF type:complete len:421 (-),score=62.42 TRINITY_DN2026_c0_g1_i2:106-1368(-)